MTHEHDRSKPQAHGWTDDYIEGVAEKSFVSPVYRSVLINRLMKCRDDTAAERDAHWQERVAGFSNSADKALADAGEDIQGLQKQVRRWKRLAILRSETLQEFDDRIGKKKRRIAELEADQKVARLLIRNLKKDITEFEQSDTRAKKIISDLEDKVAKGKRLIAERENRIAELEEELELVHEITWSPDAKKAAQLWQLFQLVHESEKCEGFEYDSRVNKFQLMTTGPQKRVWCNAASVIAHLEAEAQPIDEPVTVEQLRSAYQNRERTRFNHLFERWLEQQDK